MTKSILAIDIGTTSIVSIVAQNDYNNKINILGIGKSTSYGIQKGAIVDIDLASSSIKNAVDIARNSSPNTIDSTIVSISGIHTKSRRSNGSINVPSGHITHKEINQVLTIALYDAQIVPEYEAIHVIPLYFKVDNNDSIENPLNMNGSRLEVYANIITAKKTSLTNIQSALKTSNIEVTNFVLSSYASTIATIQKDQMKLGTAVFDLGGSTSEIAIYKNRSILFNDIVPIGSEHITNDLSIMLHTPLNAASRVKTQYASLIPKSDILNQNTITKVKVPILGNESELKEISLDLIQPMIHARVEEILCLSRDKLIHSGLYDTIHGIVLTGGMSKIPGIELLARKVFPNVPVKISNPINIQNGYIDFNDATLSTIVGLLFYGLDNDPAFELDSNKQLRIKKEIPKKESPTIVKKENKDTKNEENSEPHNNLNNLDLKIEEKKSKVSSIWKKFSEWL
ncbi:MAG: cell division protein FtsA [Arcobacteraceae bacterium]|nr:cell division protein FtsA [Arcobacteraceae bacterium]